MSASCLATDSPFCGASGGADSSSSSDKWGGIGVGGQTTMGTAVWLFLLLALPADILYRLEWIRGTIWCLLLENGRRKMILLWLSKDPSTARNIFLIPLERLLWLKKNNLLNLAFVAVVEVPFRRTVCLCFLTFIFSFFDHGCSGVDGHNDSLFFFGQTTQIEFDVRDVILSSVHRRRIGRRRCR
uniref:Uncharacterized protein n=1 Tax=Romanomermis culicivorax TaxID=13658 RepID=A0A915INH2_ROMCU